MRNANRVIFDESGGVVLGHFGIEKFLQRLLFHTTKLRRQIQQCDKYVSLLYLIMLLKEII